MTKTCQSTAAAGHKDSLAHGHPCLCIDLWQRNSATISAEMSILGGSSQG